MKRNYLCQSLTYQPLKQTRKNFKKWVYLKSGGNGAGGAPPARSALPPALFATEDPLIMF